MKSNFLFSTFSLIFIHPQNKIPMEMNVNIDSMYFFIISLVVCDCVLTIYLILYKTMLLNIDKFIIKIMLKIYVKTTKVYIL
ncbi:protein of unknown function [Methanocaldococcus lauensis]|nr:protein of unknown function [Methanocaldococcus lauensis]